MTAVMLIALMLIVYIAVYLLGRRHGTEEEERLWVTKEKQLGAHGVLHDRRK